MSHRKVLEMISGQPDSIWRNLTVPEAFNGFCSFSLFKIPARMYGRERKLLTVMGKDGESSGKNLGDFFFLFNIYSFRVQKVLHINRREAITGYLFLVLVTLKKAVKLVLLAVLAFWRYYLVNDQWNTGEQKKTFFFTHCILNRESVSLQFTSIYLNNRVLLLR